MIDENVTIKHILGLKIKDLRLKKNLSFQQLAQATSLSISYLNEIEKGKKYPKGDKIMTLAQALEVSYDDLVSLKVPKNLEPIVGLLQSKALKDFPLELFGLDTQKLVELISYAPKKFNAFISTISKIARNYELSRESFYFAALRSYQEIHDNYFPELEKGAKSFKKDNNFGKGPAVKTEFLREILKAKYGISINHSTLGKHGSLEGVRSYYMPQQKVLMINSGLSTSQKNFLIGREIAFQFLSLTERPTTTPPQAAPTFEGLLNNFKASYFSAALLIDEQEMIKDIRKFAQLNTWNESRFLKFLTKYQATPEMLLQRITNILPKYFGVHNLFFLRFLGADDDPHYLLTKELHLTRLHKPHANGLSEHYCRRWISLEIIRKLRDRKKTVGHLNPISGAQISKYWQTENEYLCLSIAQPNASNPNQSFSVTIGFLIDGYLKSRIKFLKDPKLVKKVVHTTCERCSQTNCEERIVPSAIIEKEHRQQEVAILLQQISEQAQS